MNDSKPWYASTGVWGGVIAIVAPLLGVVFHKSLSSADAAQLTDALATAGAAVGGILAVYGRVSATTTIGSAK